MLTYQSPPVSRLTARIAQYATCAGVILLLAISNPPSTAMAQEADGPTVGVQGGKFGVGFASSWPAYGISGTYQANEKITGQVVLGLLGTVTNIGVRGLYRFNRNVKYDLYGFAGLGFYRYSYNFLGIGESETVVGVGFGAGIETGLPELVDDPEFPPIFLSAEIGLALATFDVYQNFSTFGFGAGIHYRFGGQ